MWHIELWSDSSSSWGLWKSFTEGMWCWLPSGEGRLDPPGFQGVPTISSLKNWFRTSFAPAPTQPLHQHGDITPSHELQVKCLDAQLEWMCCKGQAAKSAAAFQSYWQRSISEHGGAPLLPEGLLLPRMLVVEGDIPLHSVNSWQGWRLQSRWWLQPDE